METVSQTMRGEVGELALPQLQSPVSFRPALTLLHKQRRETAALRELWHSLAEKRERRLRELKDRELAVCLDSRQHIATMLETATPSDQNHVIEAAGQNTTFNRQRVNATKASEVTKENVSDQPLPLKPAPTLSNLRAPPPTQAVRRVGTVPSLRSKTSQRRSVTAPRGKVTSSKHFRHDDVKSPVPYHTAITRRPERTCSPRFQALTQLCSSPLPHLMEGEGVSKSLMARSGGAFPRRDIREWQNEIVKVVPERPEFAQRLPTWVRPSKVMTLRYPYKVINFDPACLFYRSYTKVTDKDYIISPEWASEKHLQRPGLATRAKTDLDLRHDVKCMKMS